MVGASKILTVSYGTFSCTLEGFDDSFSTMKAIAEYFRDLAADDRYFGAEPAAPDAEMLARIAERETQRRVEAKVGESGVVLRRTDDSPQLENATATPNEAPQAELPAEEAETVGDDEESVAAKLKRIRAVVSKNSTAVSAFEGEEEIEALVSKEVGDTSQDFSDPSQEAAQIQDDISGNDLEDVSFEPEEEPTLADSEKPEEPVEQAFIEEEEILADEAFESDGETIADDNAVEETAVEAAPEDPILDDLITSVTDAYSTESEALENDDQEEELHATASPEEFDDETAESPEDLAENDEVDVDVVAIADNDSDDKGAKTDAKSTDHYSDARKRRPRRSASEAAERARARVIKMKKVDFDEAVDKGAISELAGVAPLVEDPIQDDTPVAIDEEKFVAPIIIETAEDASEEPLPFEEAISLREDVVTANSDALVLSSDDQISDEQIEEETGFEDEPTSLGESDEADLQETLAEIEEEAPEEIDAAAEDALDAALSRAMAGEEPRQLSGSEILASESTEDEAAVERLMEEANSKLDNPETSRRRSAISHLRAAVAATVADRLVKDANFGESGHETDAYRADLADVVIPKGEADKDSGVDTPNAAAAAPLVLVSEQRIDTSDDTNSADNIIHQLREVSGSFSQDASDDDEDDEDGDDQEDNVFSEGSGFEEFANDMGATELPEILEAAAAYTVYVEGRAHFSRPQVMSLASKFIGKEEFVREDGLRSFGKLLRQERIVKTRRGQFEVAEDTRFKPEARAAGE